MNEAQQRELNKNNFFNAFTQNNVEWIKELIADKVDTEEVKNATK